MCRSKRGSKQGSKQAKWLNTESSTDQCQDSSDDDESLTVCYMEQPTTRPIRVELELDGKPCELEVDTGAAVSIFSEKRVNSILPGAQLERTNVSLRTYTSEIIPI